LVEFGRRHRSSALHHDVQGPGATPSYYGYHAKTTVKALVQDDRGFKVWGTCPAKLADATENHTYDALRGQRVQFSAQLEVGDDFGFGFFSRPTKAALLGGVPA